MNKNALFLILALLVAPVFAEDSSVKDIGKYRIYYSAFNASFVNPDIASIYNITRGKDKGLVNISVVAKGASGGQTALVKGTVSNIFAQQQVLNFFEVREGDAVYYLAPFDFEDEDSMTFKIEVQPDRGEPTRNLSFQRTFYHD